jgi:hypothetical protein
LESDLCCYDSLRLCLICFQSLKTEVEKGSVLTAFGHGLVGPKIWVNSVAHWGIHTSYSKGNWVKIPRLRVGTSYCGNANVTREAGESPKKGFRPFLTVAGPWNWIIQR